MDEIDEMMSFGTTNWSAYMKMEHDDILNSAHVIFPHELIGLPSVIG